ncbi:MAG: alpha/beta hydrolase [Phycisphaerales bacterium]|nr:alpha/beta hydrolase [Phycisphaerales bacterium]
MNGFDVKQEDKFEFIDIGKGDEPIILLHGLFGALSNFTTLMHKLVEKHRVIFLKLPLVETDIKTANLLGMQNFLGDFIEFKGYKNIHLLGNSLGGHIALNYTLFKQQKIRSLTLTGSSGLFENGMGETYPRTKDYDYIRKKAEDTFYDPKIATKELVDEIFGTISVRSNVQKIISFARSAMQDHIGDRLHQIKVPTLLIWGDNDAVTPPFVAQEFHKLIKNSELNFIPQCGHAPMMESPDIFSKIYDDFLKRVIVNKPITSV